MILGKQKSWVKAYNPQRMLPISKQTLSNVAEEIQHTVEVFSFDLFHDLYFFIIIKLACETNFHKWNNKKLLLLWALKAANIQLLQISFSCLAWDPTVGAFLNWYNYIVDQHYIIAFGKMLYFFSTGSGQGLHTSCGYWPIQCWGISSIQWLCCTGGT